MYETGELDVGDVPRSAVYPLEVPDSLCTAQDISWLAGQGGWGDEGNDQSPSCQIFRQAGGRRYSRRGVNLIQEASAVVWVKYAREAPRLVLEWLHVHDLDQEEIAGLGALDFKGARQIVNPGQVDIADVVCAVVVPYLAPGPI